MAIYVQVPKDLTEVEPKFLFNLTKRQVICFGGGALVGVPLFFFTRGIIGVSAATTLMIVVMMPFFLLAMYKKNGQPLEKVIAHIIQWRFIRPAKRPYQTENFYAVIERQNRLNTEVHAIVKKPCRRQADEGRKETDCRGQGESRAG